ncbi:hypothetical protein [Sorangium sp. So ce233]|uniref:hypothetical protein n=1 Tax=Sorangium sp. So ce233 TaxID=3133290 RepID=UPI003F624068
MTTPYRDDVDALNARHAQLVEELAAVKERVRELSALEQTQRRLEGELATVRERLDGVTARRGLPLLDSIRVASPCPTNWDEMVGDDRVRFCPHCEKNVYNLSEMPRDEAERLVRASAGDLCVRLYRRADGTVLTADCPLGVNRRRIRNFTVAALGGSLLAAASTALSPSTAVMGGIAPPPHAEPDVGVSVGGFRPQPSVAQPGPADRTGMSIAPPAFREAAEAPPARGEAPGTPEEALEQAAEAARQGDEPRRRDGAAGGKVGCACVAGDPLCSCL